MKFQEVKIKIHVVVIKDEETGEAFRVRTTRTAREIFEDMEELEKETVVGKVERAVYEALYKEENPAEDS